MSGEAVGGEVVGKVGAGGVVVSGVDAEPVGWRICERTGDGWFQTGLEFLLATMAVMLAADSALILSAWGDAWLGLAACLALVGASRGRWRGRKAVKIGVAAGASVLAWVSFSAAEPPLRLALVAWLFGGLHLAVERPGASGKAPGGPPRFLVLHLASLSYGIILATYGRSDYAWSLVRRLSEHAPFSGSPADAWVSGFPIYLFGFLILLWQVVTKPRGTRWGIRLPAHLGLLAGGLIASRMIWDHLDLTASLRVSVMHTVAIGVVAAVAALASVSSSEHRLPSPGQTGSGEPRQHDGEQRGLRQAGPPWPSGLRVALLAISPRAAFSVAILAALTIAGLGRGGQIGVASSPDSAICYFTGADSTKPHSHSSACAARPTSFAIYSSGLLDWAVPDSTRVGLFNSGMFGLFKRSLERCALRTGGKVMVFDSQAGSLTSGTLEGTSVVVFINPTAVPADQTLCAIRDFVRSGGGLLMLGDHTDIQGSREPLNTILSFTHMSLNFDSAVPLRQHWRGCLEVRRHALGGAVAAAAPGGLHRDPNLHLQIAVGASLDVKRPAFPVVIGRYGFADAGDPSNGGSQAFIGNLKHDGGERLGNVVLVAAEEVGRGRVLVFGDTSPFQNGALFLSQDLVAGAVRWLAGSERFAVPARDLAWSDQHAVVDFSTCPHASAALFNGTSLGGLANCLAREGITARPAFSPAEWTSGNALMFLISPTSLGTGEVGRLLDYMEQGGHVILSQGYAEPQPCEALLQLMDLGIQDIPLGGGDSGGRVAHKDAYAIRVGSDGDQLLDRAGPLDGVSHAGGASSLAGDATVLARAFGHPTVVVRRYGRGSFTLVSDGKFFSDANLEGERAANHRNIRFVHHLVDLLREEADETVRGEGVPGPHAEALAETSDNGARQISN